MFDRTALEEIGENLISNAIKYGRGRPIHVQLTASERELCLCVEDQGLGISAENKDRIFQQFERLMTGHSNTGFGLGLWWWGSLSMRWAAASKSTAGPARDRLSLCGCRCKRRWKRHERDVSQSRRGQPA